MPWCPKCKNEYREGFTNCSDCGCELVELLEAEEDKAEVIEHDIEVFFMSVTSDNEAKIIESKLNAFGVPTLKKFRGIDGIYGNVSFSGVDIYVPSKLLDNAKDIINNQSK